MENKASLLIVDDEQIALRNLEHIMVKEGYDVQATQSGPNALRLIEEKRFDILLTDLKMEKVDGMQLLKKCKSLYPDTEVIVITGYATVETAIQAIKKGAYDYITKPFKLDEVRRLVKEAVEKVRLKQENALLREQIENYQGKVKIITQDPEMRRLLETARQIAPTDCNVLIHGESGTGKELFARYIHLYSRRTEGPFFAINCGAFNEELLGNELFGHEKGAFTGALALKKGLIETASGGTLFLDEITEMPVSMQVKLLRVIQEKEVLRLGGTSPVSVDVRFVAASNRDIQDTIKGGGFRQDLYFRLNVVSFRIPPLSERKEDVSLLSYYFLKKHAAIMKKEVNEISSDVIAILMNYDFPGNVRELENIMERGVALSNGNAIELAHLPEDIRELSIRTFRKKEGKIPSLEEQEMAYINWVIGEVGNNKTIAAQILGIDRVSLWRKLKKYGIEGE
ncbi:Acetoacetate metabolism regulatory protein AtoC [Candidatus Sulfobium mesophilum]|uniref:Acetoacetate metabolism regulatory protein AtoC n=1 Tax=Candidatus Sulfobium mesophilum TaxID=2016548 RepID=A0A2U3QKD9_9BACT|nr:Acetoacetate metabolism regulatory protein AtoC [Candidatus Sulfobium mesophilum]